MATPEEIKESITEHLVEGIAESQFSDRRERKFSPNEMLDALDRIESRQRPLFVRVGFSGRHV